jgi:hypothetical protein
MLSLSALHSLQRATVMMSISRRRQRMSSIRMVRNTRGDDLIRESAPAGPQVAARAKIE